MTMETSSLSSNVADCASCSGPKPAAWCRGCPRERGCHIVRAEITRPVDVLIICEAPHQPRLIEAKRLHTPFSDEAGQIINNTYRAILDESPAHANLQVGTTYAVLCMGADPNKDTIDRCKGFLHGSLRAAMRDGKPPVVLAMGMAAVKALGIKAASLKAVQSRVIPGVVVDGQGYTVIPTFSAKQVAAMPGIYTTFANDVRRAIEIASTGILKSVPLEDLIKDYVFPKTISEVKELCEHIIQYAEDGRPADKWTISVDTETNTLLYPHNEIAKILAVSFAWGSGKAAAIPLWHPECPYDPEEAAPYVKAVLACAKPKCFHNAKYDLKIFRTYGWTVNNFAWDTMLAEHILEEDKKGQYGLKDLTRTFFPEFSGYADVLHKALEEQEGGSQLENVRKKKKLESEEVTAELLGKKPAGRRKKKEDGGFEKIALGTLLQYAAIDTDMTRRISLGQLKRINAEDAKIHKMKVFAARDTRRPRDYPIPDLCKHPSPAKLIVGTISVPITKVLSKMEYTGVRVDRPYLDYIEEKLGEVIQTSERELLNIAGVEALKLSAPQQVAAVLFSTGFKHPETGKPTIYPPVTYTKTGQIQTTEKVLKHLVAKYQCPFSAKLLVYRKAVKAKNTFIANVRDLSEKDGNLHTNYNIHGTATFRLSSNDENMQNIPKKLAGYSIKKMFVPSDDSMVFVNADAKGAEVRIFSAYSGDSALINSLNDGLDTHCFFAATIIQAVRTMPGASDVLHGMGLNDEHPFTYEDFNNRELIKLSDPKYGEMMDKFRTIIKRVVFGILYGAGPTKIAETSGTSIEIARSVIDLLFRMFPSIPAYIERTKWELRTFGYVETYFGRRRRFSVKGAPKFLLGRAERQAVNFKIQSTSSDIVLGRLIDVDGPLTRDLGGRLLITVHDSIAFELPKKYLSQLPDFVETYLERRAAEAHPWLPVAFKWDFEVGPSYGELQSYETYMAGVRQREEAVNEVEEAFTEEEARQDLALDATEGAG